MNIAQEANHQLANQQWGPPLWRYEQTNCKCTLTDNGYRIYRPPNITYNSSDSTTRTMWGGFLLQYPNPPFVQGHRYILTFDIKGKTTNQPSSTYWSNNAGWGGGSYGLGTDATDIKFTNIPANFNSNTWTPVIYEWTVGGPVYKTCTTAYSSFVQGQTYPVFRDFKYGFNYVSTGSLGTDLYIKNIRIYDLTAGQQINISKKQIVTAAGFIEPEVQRQASFSHGGEIQANQFYEI